MLEKNPAVKSIRFSTSSGYSMLEVHWCARFDSASLMSMLDAYVLFGAVSMK